MKRIAIALALVAAFGSAMAQSGFRLSAKGTGENIAAVNIEAGRNGQNVRGTFTAKLRSAQGDVQLRGLVVRLGPDPNHPHIFLFAGRCKGSDGLEYGVEGACKDGDVPERDGITFTMSKHGTQIFHGATTRQLVRVERV